MFVLGTRIGTFDRFSYDLDLENNSVYPKEIQIRFPGYSKIRGFAEIKYGSTYWQPDHVVTFTSDNGLKQVITNGPGNFTFSTRGFTVIKAAITGTLYNTGTGIIYAPNSFRIIVRIVH